MQLALALSWMLWSFVNAPEGEITSGKILTYRGGVASKEAPTDTRKAFDLTLYLSEKGANGGTLYWLVDERGQGAWPWWERYGRVNLGKQWGLESGTGPSLLYSRGEEAAAVLSVPLPFFSFADKKLAPDLEWKDEKLSYRVVQETKLDNRSVWEIEVRSPIGLKRTLWLLKDSLLAVGVDERVFMGMGEEYILQLRLTASEQLSGEKAKRLSGGFKSLTDVREKLNFPAHSEEIEWKPEQLKVLREAIPVLEKGLADGPLSKIARAVQRDVQLQTGRADAVAGLSKEKIGLQVPEFSIAKLDGGELTQEALKGKVTILHFWEYRDAPLKEPYGQVGYLDFLYQRHEGKGLQIYGVAVDARLKDDQTRGKAIRSVRGLKTFMNLSYGILLDGGKLIEIFGDPRVTGVQLPLWIIIGPDGKIAHYRAGLHDVDRDVGLKTLDQTVTKLLAK